MRAGGAVAVVVAVAALAFVTSMLPIREAARRALEEEAAAKPLPQSPVPVGLVARPVATPVDRRGDEIAIDPSTTVLDLPLLRVAAPRAEALWGRRVLARDADTISRVAPDVFAVISEAWIDDREAVLFLLLGESRLRIRYHPPMTGPRLRAAVVALNDAIERREYRIPREIDLRFADQVVVRTP